MMLRGGSQGFTGGLAGAGAPWVAEQIKLHTGHSENGEWKTDSPVANLVAHAILGAVVAELQGHSGVVGRASAVTGEIAAPIIQKALYGDRDVKDLTEEEKENISALTQLAVGLTIASMGGDESDIATGVNSSKNAVENNWMVQAAVITWRVIRTNTIGQPVTITAVDVLVGRGLSIAEAESFLTSLTLEQRKLIDLALVDPMGDSNFENAVQKTYESYYNEYQKKKSSNKNTDTDNALTGSTSSTASGGASLPPNDDNNNDDDEDKNNNSQNNNNNASKDPNEIKHTYNSIKDSPKYPKGFKDVQNGTVNNTVNNKPLLEQLRKIEPGRWTKVYKDGYDAAGNKVSIHYFRSQSGKVFDVKVIRGKWSNL